MDRDADKMDDNPKFQFVRLLQKYENLGLTSHDLRNLQSLKQIKKKAAQDRGRSVFYTSLITCSKLFGSVFILFAIIWILNWPVERHQLATTLLSLKGLDNKYHDYEECIVEMPGDVQNYFRPPVTCDFCQNVTHIPRLSGLTPNEFEELYAYSGHPIVVVDATEKWTAMNVYSYKFFQEVHKNVTEASEEKRSTSCQFFPYKTKFKGLDEVFNMSIEKAYMKDGSPPWYIGWKNCDFTVGSILRQHYSRPYFLPVLAESSKTDWIFMGSPGYGAHLHIDNVGNPSWQAQITGRKRWILEPPPECYYTCTPHMEIVVKPGEIMVLDANMWYHQTIIEGDEISIAIGSEYD